MVKFNSEWITINNRKILYVHPLRDITEDQWVNFFASKLPDYKVTTGYFLIDISVVADDMSYLGFKALISLFKEHSISRSYFAVLPSNAFYEKLAILFNDVGIISNYDITTEIFYSLDEAKSWLGNVI